MEKMQIFLSSQTIELSERKNYLELLNRVCFYGAPNGNNVELPYDESTLEKAKTLEGMPVYAKYTTTPDGKPTFKGHEVSVDANGEVVLNTTPIGVHMSIEIKDDAVKLADGSIATLPCLFARQKIWKRNKRAVSAVKRLFDEGKLHNSWEIETYEFAYKDGIKRLLDYVFDGNCFLGPEYASPAYGESAEVISLSAKQSEMLVAEALSQDLLENDSTGNEVQSMEEIINETVEPVAEEVIAEVVEDAPAIEEVAEVKETVDVVTEETPTEEVAALTDGDIRNMLYRALVDTLGDWPASVMVFPEEHEVWARKWESKETEMLRFTYTVEDNAVVLSEGEPVSLVVAPRNINSEFDSKNSALIDANKKIEELTSEIATLAPYKESAEKAEREAAEAKRQSEIAELREYVESSGVLSKEELESDEISSMINDLKTLEVKALIADRIVSKKKGKAPETSEKKQPKARLVIDSSVQDKPGDILKTWLRGN